eukprot:1419662-Ditylum_brightwellii.AAC.1
MSTMLEEGTEKIKTPLDFTHPINQIWEQVQQGQALATAAGQPFTEPQLINMAYHTIFVSGLITNNCHDWKCTAAVAQIWVNLKIHFNRAHREMLELQQATQQAAGYTTTNTVHATHPVASESNAAADALANLVQATKANRTTVVQLANANTQLTTEVANLTNKLNAKDKNIGKLLDVKITVYLVVQQPNVGATTGQMGSLTNM